MRVGKKRQLYAQDVGLAPGVVEEDYAVQQKEGGGEGKSGGQRRNVECKQANGNEGNREDGLSRAVGCIRVGRKGIVV